MDNRRGSGSGPTARTRMRRRRTWAVALIALLAAALAALAVATLGGGTPAGALLAESYARAWAMRDWGELYGDLDARSRTSLSPAHLASIEHAYADLATLDGASAGSAVALPGGRFSVPLRLRTRVFGVLNERFVLTTTGPRGSSRIRWSSADGFPGLRPGERLTRVDSAPRRGVLLARGDTPLTGVAGAANLVGSVGPASGRQLEQSVADGFPASTPVGLGGLEQVFQGRLGGTPGGTLYAGGRVLASAAPVAGHDIVTSISPALQSLAMTELGTSLGGIVLMAPDTGEVLAAAGAPLSLLAPPGSTFKIVTLTGVLESHLAAADTAFPYATSTTLDGFVLHDSNGEDCGGTLANAFAVSCNSVFAPLGARLGPRGLLAAADLYGFNSPSPLPIAAESVVPPGSLVDDLQLGESAIGQAQVLASPLQMARVAATIALVGRRPVPTFAIVARHLFPRVIPVGVARTVRALMRDVVSYGTGTAAQIPGVVVAGKTGTSEVAAPAACTPAGASGAIGTTGTSGPSATAASVRPVAKAARVGAGPGDGGLTRASSGATAVANAPTGGANAPTGGAAGPGAAPASGATGGQAAGGGASAGVGTGGVGAPSGGSSPAGTTPSGAGTSATGSATPGATSSPGAGSGTGGSSGSGGPPAATGPTGSTTCASAGLDNNPYDTDAWFVGFAPEIQPRFVVAVLLPHDGAGGTTAAPVAKTMLEAALAGV